MFVRSRSAKRLRLILLMGLALPAPTFAADFAVTTTADSGAGSLRQAIADLNAAGAGTHSITFNSGLGTITLSNNLPMIVGTGQTVSINGAGNAVNGQNNSRLFFIAGGNVNLQNLTVASGNATGGTGGQGGGGGGGGAGAGGGLFVNSGANVTIQGVTFAGNRAVGGTGGSANQSDGGGGGAGFAGDGGTSTALGGGGGGGGFEGSGGDASGTGGGGGGGVTGHGGDATSSGGGGGGGVGDGGASTSVFGGIGDHDGSTLFVHFGPDGPDGTPGGGGGSSLEEAGVGGNGTQNGGGGGGAGNGGSGGSGGNFGGGGGAGGRVSGQGGEFGGAGGDFGGGGGAGFAGSNGSVGGNGGFMGGGAGTSNGGTAGLGGEFAGDGGSISSGGGGGDAVGGAVFVRTGGTLTIIDSGISGSSVTAGAGGTGSTNGNAGQAFGAGLYLHTGVTTNVSVSADTTSTIADSISGTGGLEKNGTGTLVLSGTNDYTGDTSVNAGTLRVNGALSSEVTVDANGTLGGSGTITGDIINYGTLAVGNSIGTLNHTGTYEHRGGDFVVEVAPGGNTPGVHNDVLNVTGDVEIYSGRVVVNAAPGTYTDGTLYTFMTYTGNGGGDGPMGGFTSIVEDFAFFDVGLIHNADDKFYGFSLIANQLAFSTVANTANQTSVATYFDSIVGGASGGTSDLLDQFSLMSASQAQNGFEQIAGDIYGSGMQVNFLSTTHLNAMIASQLRDGLGSSQGASPSSGFASRSPQSDIQLVSYQRSACDEQISETCRQADPWRGWVLGYGLGGFSSSDGNALGIDYGIGGTTFGAQRSLGDSTQVGFFGGYAGSSISTRDAEQTIRSDGANLGAMFSHGSDEAYLLGIGGFQFSGIESDRNLVLGALATTARGEADAWQGFTYGEAGLNMAMSQRCMLQPFAGLQYIYARQDGFEETGAGAANLVVAAIDEHSLRSNVGSRLQLVTVLESGWSITPELRGSWLHEFLDTSTIVNAQLAGAGGAGFAAEGLDLGRDWGIAGGGWSARPNRRWELRADYNTQFNDRAVMHIGSGSVAYVW